MFPYVNLDLFGLLMFLRFDPFGMRSMFETLLYEPYTRAHTESLLHVADQVLWRTRKEEVLDQVDPLPHSFTRFLSIGFLVFCNFVFCYYHSFECFFVDGCSPTNASDALGATGSLRSSFLQTSASCLSRSCKSGTHSRLLLLKM